jgi:hypothetical protein
MYNNKDLSSTRFTHARLHRTPIPSVGYSTRERRNAGYKLIAGLDTRIKELVREISGPCIKIEELTTIWVG